MKIILGKKATVLFMALALVVGSLGTAFAEDIRDVNIESSRGLVLLGRAHNISWNPVNVESPIYINLIKLDDGINRQVATIAGGLHKDISAYRWRVGDVTSGEVVPGGPYKILVYTRDGNTESSPEFRIAAMPNSGSNLKPVSSKAPNIKPPPKPLPTFISVRRPAKGSEVNLLDPRQHQLTVEWLKSGQQSDKVKIFLISKDSKWSGLLKDGVNNDGSEQVQLRHDQKSGRYVIRVQSAGNGRLKGESGVFRIIKSMPSMAIPTN